MECLRVCRVLDFVGAATCRAFGFGLSSGHIGAARMPARTCSSDLVWAAC